MNSPDIVYLISTYGDYNTTAIPKLIDSLYQHGVKYIVVDAMGDRIERAFYWPADHNSFEYTALIEAANRPKVADWYFLLQVTCEVGPNFRKLVENGLNPEMDAMAIQDWGMCNMGIYRHGYLQYQQSYLERLRDINKADAVAQEGLLYRMAPRRCLYPNAGVQEQGTSDVYGTGTTRLTEYYPAVDLYKYKANWRGPQDTWILKP